MSVTSTVAVSLEPDAEELLSELGMEIQLELMVEHARRTIPGLRAIRIRFAPAYDTGEEGILIEAVRDPALHGTKEWAWDHFSRWKTTTFPPDVGRHFQLLDSYEPTNHCG